jgi:PAS domain S-box-containing protein
MTLRPDVWQRLQAQAEHEGIDPDDLVLRWLDVAEKDTNTGADDDANVHSDPTATKINHTMQISQSMHDAIIFDLLSNATDGVLVMDVQGKILLADDGITSLFGYELDQIIGANLSLLIPPHARGLHAEYMLAFAQGEQDAIHMRDRNALPAMHQNGTQIMVDISIVRYWYEDVMYFVAMLRDVRDEIALREQLIHDHSLLQRIMDSSPSGINVVDKDGAIIYANKRSEEILGAPQSRLSERTYDDPSFRHTDYDGNPWRDEQQPFVRVMKTKQPVWDVRHAIEWETGEKIYLSINGAPMLDEDGEVEKVIFTIEDYTERKKQQDALYASLEREKQLNITKSRFISVISHEFRTPMAVIMTSVGVLRMKATKQGIVTNDVLIARLARIEEQLKRLDSLIGDVTQMNKQNVIAIDPRWQQVNLAQYIHKQADAIMQAYLSHTPIVLELDENCPDVTTDVGIMQLILTNLLSNAVKYSPQGNVWCYFHCEERYFTIVIRDDGIGIPEKEQANLFSPFHRASNVGVISGTGLGLSIVKQNVEALGGTIRIESKVDVGTTVSLTFPRY